MKEFLVIIANCLRVKLEQAGYKSVLRKEFDNCVNIHIQNTRKKHIISVLFTDYTKDKKSYYINFESQRLLKTWTLWQQSQDIYSPKTEFNFDHVVEPILQFLDKITHIDNELKEAYNILENKCLNLDITRVERRGYNPKFIRVTKYHV